MTRIKKELQETTANPKAKKAPVKKVQKPVNKKVARKKVPVNVEQSLKTRNDKTDILKGNMLQALEKTLGVVTPAAKIANIARQTHYEWMREDAIYKEAVNAIEEMTLDFAESKLHKLIQEGNFTATIFFLKTKGRNRGYIERQEIEAKNINVNHDGDMTPDKIKAMSDELDKDI